MGVKAHNTTGPIIMVDDEEEDKEFFLRALEKSNLQNSGLTFDSADEFISHMTEQVMVGKSPFPALVFLDINMPGVSGFEVLVRIRNREEFNALPVIIMLTSSDYRKDVEKAEELGCNGYQTKYDDLSEFVSFLNTLA